MLINPIWSFIPFKYALITRKRQPEHDKKKREQRHNFHWRGSLSIFFSLFQENIYFYLENHQHLTTGACLKKVEKAKQNMIF